MPPIHQSLITTQLMPNTEWQVGYLNDEIIDEYIKLLEKWASKMGRKIITANTKFYQIVVQGKSWRKKVDLKKFDKLVFPSQFSPNHWSLGVVDFQHSTISIVDPLGGQKSNARHYENLRKFLYERGFQYEWQVSHIDHPTQHDAVSCGVYVLKIAECIILKSGAHMEFSRDEIDDYRYTVAERLMEGK
ncbi:ubiquitin-like-specific protease 1 [Actinia tenebrosa]|uniref:Ubiquitin-like-specific protease 1 n=1 Tax=Actinia tenebrosa TaxID=6105 RepID=A0A6P8I646_ACTTE|nr:ubiquitin-like-specific protease 1 [Actinia tenebrosa]